MAEQPSSQSRRQPDDLITRSDLNAVAPEPTRREMLTELLIHEDLLPSGDWPWTTDQLRAAYAQLQARRAS